MRTGTTDKIEILLLRHGETLSNAERRYLGQTDEPLSDKGREELFRKKEKYKELTPDILFSGPMRRCRETAEMLFAAQPVLIPEWTEIDFGAFEMKNAHDLEGNPDYRAWINSGGTLPFPGGESREDFIRRSTEGFDRMLSAVFALRRERPDGIIRAAAVVHGGTIMAVMSTLTAGEYFDFYEKNGEGYLLCFETDNSGRPVLSDYKSTFGKESS